MNKRPLIVSGTMLGIGLGGFVDGILFHQILQLHSMLSAKIPLNTLVNVEINMVWDGLFHVLTWAMTVAGIVQLWNCGKRKDVPWSGRILTGALIMGWGIFNFVEGIINHLILEVHHVVESIGLSKFDYAFVILGIIFITIGISIIKSVKDFNT